MADWEPPSARPAPTDDWEPPSARIPVRAHARRKRGVAAALLPSILGGVGELGGGALGVAGGPLGIQAGRLGGSTLGGSLGELGAELLSGELLDPGAIAGAGGTQAAMTAAGGLAMKGVRAAAPAIMRAAILPSKAIRMAFEDVGKTALEEGVGVGGGKLGMKILGGSRKANEIRAASSAAEDALLQQAHGQGVTFQITDLAKPIIERAEGRLGRALNPKEERRVLGQIWGVVNDAFRANTFGAVRKAPNVLSPTDLKMVKQYAQDASKGIFSKEAQAVVAAGNPKAARAVAGLAKDALETIPGVAEQTAKTKSLIGLTRSTRAREAGSTVAEDVIPFAMRGGIRGGAAALGAGLGAAHGQSPQERVTGGIAGAAAGATLTSPAVLSILAHAMNNPLLTSLLFRAAPRAIQGGIAATEP